MPSQNLPEFLAYYEAAHQHPANRAMHHVAHVVGPVGGALLVWRPLLGFTLVAVGFLMSWAGHFFFEKNRPAFFDAADRGGSGAALAQKSRVALGGVVWSAACLLRVFHRGPLTNVAGSSTHRTWRI